MCVFVRPYDQIDTDSGFSDAFKDRGQRWAQQLVAVGEIVTLPLVVLISFLAQPRLMYAMAEDGLIPKVKEINLFTYTTCLHLLLQLFGEVNSSGNLSKGILVSGAVCTLVARKFLTILFDMFVTLLILFLCCL